MLLPNLKSFVSFEKVSEIYICFVLFFGGFFGFFDNALFDFTVRNSRYLYICFLLLNIFSYVLSTVYTSICRNRACTLTQFTPFPMNTSHSTGLTVLRCCNMTELSLVALHTTCITYNLYTVLHTVQVL